MRILDTRKTTPGLRALEKEAVRAGGGVNHRAGLFDAMLVKENHADARGRRAEAARLAIETARSGSPWRWSARRSTTWRGARRGRAAAAAGQHGARTSCATAVTLVGGRAELEASGGVTLETVRAVAETGVDFISVGALTHSAPALDVSLLLDPL